MSEGRQQPEQSTVQAVFFKLPLNVHSKMPGIQSLDIQSRLTFVAVQRARGDRHNNRDLPQPCDAQSLGAVPGGAFGLTERFTFCTSDKLRSRSLSVVPAATIIALSAELRIPEWTGVCAGKQRSASAVCEHLGTACSFIKCRKMLLANKAQTRRLGCWRQKNRRCRHLCMLRYIISLTSSCFCLSFFFFFNPNPFASCSVWVDVFYSPFSFFQTDRQVDR